MARKQYAPDCGLHAALTVIGGKWKPAILCELHLRPARFGELKRRVLGISEKVLFEQLRELEADGVVGRAVFDVVPPKVEYSLTPTGAALSHAVHALVEWGRNHASLATAERG
ncbi:winged helix-turn-helix transcriptional regulator [Pyxidicoccus xibeiensis]|uniref:winged helix-turn-helix transcriptional regulator n=1 Tax=Pyxidicoccus xibeiensis TaxID=2906759 RepID=UPI0020A78609|nr:helix-turn-helix domain-containing protein [Pyxidicoccus xibeiensis]MCP3143591.1 helix-turn-helix transcriptional regulator [Pyxidicoccus xibeiensis]